MKFKFVLRVFLLLILITEVTSCKSDSRQENCKEEDLNDKVLNSESKELSTQGVCTQIMPFTLMNLGVFVMEMGGYREQTTISNFYKSNNNYEQLFESEKHIDSLSRWLAEDSENKRNLLRAEGAILGDLIWEYNELHIKFLDGNQDIQNRVINYAKEWEKWCSVRFVFNNSDRPDVTITFEDKGYWSYIGSESLNKVPSMSLSNIEDENPEDFRGVVLHEFGHVLGLIHEHQSPNFDFEWNEQEVINYYDEKYGWDEEKTKLNIIYQYSFDQINDKDATSFDPESIMIYHIPKRFIRKSTTSYERNNNLSETDKSLIVKKYY
ncbi:M12 family metallopeptidase [Aquimarina sp. D1M17]|uniref:M12 family metallopeptidase n=1 Tax=Aquimarina acroporae TaxID=2937283 RepID=UPI0020C0C4D8|nr:M12 family metallopeptidase [Aquimarina acroporae]MCK8520080.1 M12 family metallopeptidase [Aquimarina acroporae]